jgi:hypothetical protein
MIIIKNKAPGRKWLNLPQGLKKEIIENNGFS